MSTASKDKGEDAEVVSLETAKRGAKKSALRAARSHQEWDEDVLEPSGYDVTKFYTASAYGDSGTGQQRLSLANQINHRIDAIVQSGHYPYYETRQDLIRDAIYHRLQWLGEHYDMGAEFNSALATMAFEQSVIWHQSYVDTMDRIIEASEKLVESATKRGDFSTLTGFIDSAKVQLENLPSPYFERLELIVRDAEGEASSLRMKRRRQHNKDKPIEPGSPHT